MNRKNNQFLLSIFIFTGLVCCSTLVRSQQIPLNPEQEIPIKDNQFIFIGKEWRNNYTLVKGDQFLFSKEFMSGTVSMNGITYNGLEVNYDIYNDELIAKANRRIVVQMNKEMIDSFSLSSQLHTYRFINIRNDSLTGIGYVNVLYNQKSILFIKYKKEIEPLAVDDKWDLFFRTSRIYLMVNGVNYHIGVKKDLFNALPEYKTQIKEFMIKNKLKVSKNAPESFIPVIRYYDSIRK